nr:hypothetical protein [Tanacetum cinerariifolium]
MISSIRVKDATAASGSKPRSNIKKDRTLPTKSDKKKVEYHSGINKSSVKQKNRVDSSVSYKRTVINSNSKFGCKTFNKCLMSFNHDKYVVKSLKFAMKPTANKPTRRKFTLGKQCPLTRFTESKVVPVKQPKSVSTSDIVITERFSNTSQKPLTRYQRKNTHEKAISTATPTTTVTQSIDDYVKLYVCANQQDPNRNWGSNVPNSLYSSVFKCMSYKSSFGEAVEASKRRRSLFDHKIQQLFKGSSEGFGIIPEAPDEPNDNSGSSNNLLS